MNPQRGLAAILELIDDEDWHERSVVTQWIITEYLQDVEGPRLRSRGSGSKGSKRGIIVSRLYQALESEGLLERRAHYIRILDLDNAKLAVIKWRREILIEVMRQSNHDYH